MSAQCFIDLFDSTAFRGERRRIYGPARFEAHLLGLDRNAAVSVRVGQRAALHIDLAEGKRRTLRRGEQLDSLPAGHIIYLEVQPDESPDESGSPPDA